MFDVRDQLGEVRQGPTILGRYGYDYDGRRILKIGDDGRRQYTYDQLSVITEADQVNNTVSKFDYGMDQLVRLDNRGEGRSFFHLDGLRSTVSLTDPVGAARQLIFYDAWGNERDRIGSSANNFTFTGHELDEETGLIYAKARFYDPDIGRFLSQDSLLGTENDPPTLHRYFYANANPTRFSDPTGNWSWEGIKEGLKNTPRAIAEPFFWVYDVTLSVGAWGWDIPTDYLRLQSGLAERQLRRIEQDQSGAEAATKGALETTAAVFTFGTTSVAQGHYEAYQDLASGNITFEEYDYRLSQMAGTQSGVAIFGAAASRASGRTWTGRARTSTPEATVVNEGPSQNQSVPEVVKAEPPQSKPQPSSGPLRNRSGDVEQAANTARSYNPRGEAAGAPRQTTPGTAPVEIESFSLAKHGEMPSPRAGMESHHGAMSRWMEERYPGYNPNKAPAVLMPKEAHNATRGVYNNWRAAMKQQMGGTFDWSKVSEADIRALGDMMFQASKTPKQIQQGYWQWFNRMKSALERQQVAR